MAVFLLGLVLSGLFGGGTWLFTHDTGLSLWIAAIVAAITWFGTLFILLIDGDGFDL